MLTISCLFFNFTEFVILENLSVLDSEHTDSCCTDRLTTKPNESILLIRISGLFAWIDDVFSHIIKSFQVEVHVISSLYATH